MSVDVPGERGEEHDVLWKSASEDFDNPGDVVLFLRLISQCDDTAGQGFVDVRVEGFFVVQLGHELGSIANTFQGQILTICSDRVEHHPICLIQLLTSWQSWRDSHTDLCQGCGWIVVPMLRNMSHHGLVQPDFVDLQLRTRCA
eukprot:CAMPEP_0206628956 /NCGR_PEP_ID=MMETSP0325_2-20121206/66791_1 /ASSEMBLY_ACC=CAM_ASM_000347 /TAXON_ID=2866 /ORGANISM="Crypthecodinium cohnii, Strain Seligo" /LENGTH=143 /DNA_ID=CAMNT_0054153733 /DNA_START=276 /DNA_END=707 /DNA_ORIENTATION=+